MSLLDGIMKFFGVPPGVSGLPGPWPSDMPRPLKAGIQMKVAVCPGTLAVATANEHGEVAVWEPDGSRCRRVAALEDNAAFLAWAPLTIAGGAQSTRQPTGVDMGAGSGGGAGAMGILALDSTGPRLIDPARRKVVATGPRAVGLVPFWASATPDLSVFACADFEEIVIARTSDMFSGGRVVKVRADMTRSGSLSPDGSILVAGGDSEFMVIRTSDGLVLREYPQKFDYLGPLALIPGRNAVVAAWHRDTFNNDLGVIDLETGEVTGMLGKPVACQHTALVSPDGAWAVTAGNDRAVRVWNLATLEPADTFANLGGLVKDAAFLPGFNGLVAVGEFNTPFAGRFRGATPSARHAPQPGPPAPAFAPCPAARAGCKESPDPGGGRTVAHPASGDGFECICECGGPDATIVRTSFGATAAIALSAEEARVLQNLPTPLAIDDGCDAPLARRPRITGRLQDAIIGISGFVSGQWLHAITGKTMRSWKLDSASGFAHEPEMTDLSPVFDHFATASRVRLTPWGPLDDKRVLLLLRGYGGADLDHAFIDRPVVFEQGSSGPVFQVASEGLAANSIKRIVPHLLKAGQFFITIEVDAGAVFHIDDFIMTELSYLLDLSDNGCELTFSGDGSSRKAPGRLPSGQGSIGGHATHEAGLPLTRVPFSGASLDGCDYHSAAAWEYDRAAGTISWGPFTLEWPYGPREPGRHLDSVLCARRPFALAGEFRRFEADLDRAEDSVLLPNLAIDLISRPGHALFHAAY